MYETVLKAYEEVKLDNITFEYHDPKKNLIWIVW